MNGDLDEIVEGLILAARQGGDKERRTMRKTIRYTMEDLSDIVTMLKKGGGVALPTETVYGLAVDGRNDAAMWWLFDVKKRPREKAISVLVSGMEMVEDYCQNIPQAAYRLAEKYWPGPPDHGAGGQGRGLRPDHGDGHPGGPLPGPSHDPGGDPPGGVCPGGPLGQPHRPAQPQERPGGAGLL